MEEACDSPASKLRAYTILRPLGLRAYAYAVSQLQLRVDVSERASLGVSKKSSLVQVKHLFTRRDGKVQTIAQPVFDMCPVTVLARNINRLCGDLIKA